MKLTALITALFQAPQALAPSAAGSDPVTMPALARQKVLTITPAAGAGPYVRDIYFPRANRAAGDVVLVRVAMPASANPTINLRDDTAAGPILRTIAPTGAAFTDLWILTHTGTAWA